MEMRGEEKEMRNPILQHHNTSSETLDPPPHPTPEPDQVFLKMDPKLSSGALNLKPPLASPTRYGDCLKNHAASIGGNAVDGCGEFMASGEEGTLLALKCAACNCHRNFHRKKVENGMVHPLQLHPPLPSPSQSLLKLHHNMSTHWMASVAPQPVKMAFAGGSGSGGTESSSEDLNNLNYCTFQSSAVGMGSSSKKRFRTKFTQEQKERMMEFAGRVGWRIPKEEDAEVQRFCAQVGVKRQVFKVWMHNNKSSNRQQHLHDQPQQQQQQQQEQAL